MEKVNESSSGSGLSAPTMAHQNPLRRRTPTRKRIYRLKTVAPGPTVRN